MDGRYHPVSPAKQVKRKAIWKKSQTWLEARLLVAEWFTAGPFPQKRNKPLAYSARAYYGEHKQDHGPEKRGDCHHIKCLRLRPGKHPGAERGPAAGRLAGGVRPGGEYLHGQAVRQGLQPSPIPAAGQKIKAGRPALYQEHRPAGTKL